MPLDVHCSHCQAKHTLLDSFRGQEVKCKSCQRPFVATARPAAVTKRGQKEDGWNSVRPERKAGSPAAAEADLIPLTDASTDDIPLLDDAIPDDIPLLDDASPDDSIQEDSRETPARFSITISSPPQEQGGHWDDASVKTKQRRGFIYTPERVDLEKMRAREAAGDYSGLLLGSMAGVAVVFLGVLVGLVFIAAFVDLGESPFASRRPAPNLQPVLLAEQARPAGNRPNPGPVIPFPVNPRPVNPFPVNPRPVNPLPVNPQPVNPLPVKPVTGVPAFPDPTRQPPRVPPDRSRENGIASVGFAGQPPRPWFEKTPAEALWEAQNKNCKVLYLSDLPEEVTAAADQSFGKNGQVGNRNKNTIQVQGRASPRGLGICGPAYSYCAVQYVLPPGTQHFKALVALNDSSQGPANTEKYQFAVLLDGKTVAVSRILSVRGELDSCTVNVSGARVLELRGYTLRGRLFQHPVWLEPRFYVQQ